MTLLFLMIKKNKAVNGFMLYHNIQRTTSKHSLLTGDQTANSFLGLTSRLVAKASFVAQLPMEGPFATSIRTMCVQMVGYLCSEKKNGNVFNKEDDKSGNG